MNVLNQLASGGTSPASLYDSYQGAKTNALNRNAFAQKREQENLSYLQDQVNAGLVQLIGETDAVPEEQRPAVWNSGLQRIGQLHPALGQHLNGMQYDPQTVQALRGGLEQRGLVRPAPKQQSPIAVSPGTVLVDPSNPTKPIFSNPSRAPAQPAAQAAPQGGVAPPQIKPTAIPSEIQARLALGENYARQVPDLLKFIDSGQMSNAGVAVNVGDSGIAAKRQESGVDALIRNLTGAGMSVPEALAYASRYRFEWNDTDARKREKVLQLVSELRTIDRSVKEGRGWPATDAYDGIEAPKPLSAGEIPQISSDEEFDALPSGTEFMDPDGQIRVKP